MPDDLDRVLDLLEHLDERVATLEARSVEKISCSASLSVGRSPGGNFPAVTVARPASAEPRQKPAPKACRMFRTRRRSRNTNDDRSDSS